MSSLFPRFGIPRALVKYVAVVALVASGLTLGIAATASAAPTITEAAGFPMSVEANANTINITPAHIGDLVILTSQIHSQSITVSSVTSADTGTWTPAESFKDTTNGVITEEIWWAVATATTAATPVTVNYSASIGVLTPELTADSFTTSQPSTWSAETPGGGAAATATTTITYPMLTSASGSAAQLYWGYAESTSLAVAGSTTGFTYTSTTDGSDNLSVFDPSLAASTAYTPTASQTSANSTAIAAIFEATATDTITFNSEGGTTEANMSGPDGTTITLPTPTQAGYVFNGWFTAPTGGTHETSPYTLAGSTTLFAQWTANPSVTVSFNSEGGTTETAQTGPTGSAITLPAPTLAGSTFNGWFTAATGGTQETSPYTLTATLTLFAQWTANASATVSFNSEGGTAETAQTGAIGTTITLPTPTLAGSTFDGWFTAATGGIHETSPYTLTGTLTLFAQWTATDTITFNSEGGTAETAQSGANGTTITLPTPTLAGSTFTGWFTAATGGTHETSPYTLTATLTLFAQWTANASATVSFNSEGGTAETAQTGAIGTTITLPTPTLVGSTFTGWFTAATGGTHETSPYTLTGTLTLFAQWTVNGTFTVTFNNNGGQGSLTSQTEDNPTALTLFETGTMTQTNSYFAGWNTAADGSGTYYGDGAIFPFTANTTLYAVWNLVSTGPSLLPLGVTAASGTVSFGASFTPSATVSAGLTAGDTAVVSGTIFTYTGTGSTTYAASKTAPTAVGTYSVTPSGSTVTVTPAADQTKYSTTYAYVSGVLTITAATLTVTAGNVSIEVGGTVSPSATVSGLVGTDSATASTVTYTYTGTGSTTYAASTTAPTAAGTYSITPSAATVTVSPAADASDYGLTYTYVPGTLTITPKPKPPVVLHASRIIGSILPGHRISIAITGTGFSGQPKITGTTKGIKVSVTKDSGTRLTVWVTVPKGTRAGHGTFTIRLSNGKSCKIAYVIK